MSVECQVNIKSQSELDIGGRETCQYLLILTTVAKMRFFLITLTCIPLITGLATLATADIFVLCSLKGQEKVIWSFKILWEYWNRPITSLQSLLETNNWDNSFISWEADVSWPGRGRKTRYRRTEWSMQSACICKTQVISKMYKQPFKCQSRNNPSSYMN